MCKVLLKQLDRKQSFMRTKQDRHFNCQGIIYFLIFFDLTKNRQDFVEKNVNAKETSKRQSHKCSNRIPTE